MSRGAGPTRDQRSGDDDVLLLDMLGGQRGLLGLIFFRHFLGVTARGLCVLEFFVFDREELGAQAFHLLLGRGPHVGCGHDGAETPRGRNRLQAGDTDTHDEYFRGRYGAGRRHHHRQRTAIFLRGIDDGTISGEIGLAGEHVHRLRARDAWHQFHREGGNPRIGHLLQRGVIAVRIHDGNNERALLVGGEFARRGPPHFQDNVGIFGNRIGDLSRRPPRTLHPECRRRCRRLAQPRLRRRTI